MDNNSPLENEVLDLKDLLKQIKVIASNGKPMGLEAGINFEIQDVVSKCYQHKKAGEVNIKLKFTPSGMNAMGIQGILNAVEPKVNASAITAYVDSRGRLYGDDPNQQKLSLTPPTHIAERTGA